MTIVQALILGVVQGITEFLPISSSGHLVIFQNLLGVTESQITFDVFLHVSSLLAILVFFFPKIIKITSKQILALIVGTIPAVIVGFLLKDYINILFASTTLVSITLIITGIFNFISDYLLKNQNKNPAIDQKNIETTSPSWKSALVIGAFQALAIIPGISRSGSTLLGGLSQKLDRQSAFDFAFLLAIPAILGAGLLQGLDIYQAGLDSITIDWTVFIVGGLASFISGFLCLTFFNYILKSAKLKWFGVYCITIGIASFFFL